MIALACSMTAGCVNMSGLDGSSDKFTCSAPEGVACMSVSGVSANVDKGNLPSSVVERQKKEELRDTVGGKGREDEAEKKSASVKREPYRAEQPQGISPAAMLTPSAGTPIRIPPKELRVWLAPNEDVDGDLHDQRYVYVVVNDGRWVLDSARPSLRTKGTRMIAIGNAAEPAPSPRPATSTQGTRATGSVQVQSSGQQPSPAPKQPPVTQVNP
jgi:conjugal transfer pilus assembly protein TraV